MLVTEKDEPLLRRHRRGAAPLVVYLILFFVVWSLRATVFFHFDQKFESPLSKAVYSNTLKLVIWVLPAVVYLKWRAGERPLQYLKLTTRVNERGLRRAVLASFAFFGGVVFLEQFVLGKSLHLSNLPAVAVWSSSVSSLLEEMFFRGFVLNELWGAGGFLRANAMAAALFALAHWPNWLWVGGFQTGLILPSFSILVLGIFLGYLMKWADSLWPSIAAHAINNVLSILLRA